MKKRFLSLLLVFSILATLTVALPTTVSAETSGTCGSNLTWTLDDNGTLTVSGTGAMWNWSYSNRAPWYNSRDSIKSVIISDGVTSIGEGAFLSCESLTSVTIPKSVTSIGNEAFCHCTSLTSITIPNSVTSIGDDAFYYCTSLTSVTIPDGVTSIGHNAFRHCTSLTSITIPNSVTSIDGGAFFDCTSLTSITIPNSVTSIGDYAFYYCTSLTSITMPNSVTSIEAKTFYYCTSLTSITIPDSVTIIGREAFFDCTSLTSITIPNSVKNIVEWAFYDCTSLTDVYYGGSEEDWAEINIGLCNTCLTDATIHYNSYGLIENTKHSNSTSANAPVIKSAELQYNGKTYDIINRSVDIQKNSGAAGNIVLDIDWKDVATVNRSVYITQGASTKNDLAFGEYGYDYLIDTFTDFKLEKDFQAGKPVYIIAMDKSKPEVKSTSVLTKLNIIDLSTDEVYQESLTGDFNFKLGKDTEIQLPDDVPVIGGMKLSWKMSPIPITVAYKSADTMSLAIGCNVVTENKDGIKKFKDFDFDKYKKSIIDAGKKQGRTLKQLRHDFRLSNDIKVSMFDDKILSGGSGDVDSGVDVLGGISSILCKLQNDNII